MALGASPAYVDHGKAIVYERRPKVSGASGEAGKTDLWRLELKPGASPRLIIPDAGEPGGQMP